MAKLNLVLLRNIVIFICISGTLGTTRHKHNKQSRRFLISHSGNPGGGSRENNFTGLPPTGAWPNIFNLATKARVEANATCGEHGREEFCKEGNSPRGRAAQCGICDGHSPDPNKKHPIKYAIEANNNWWQSPSLAEGVENEQVTITIDLGQEYEVAHVILRAGPSPRPAAFILERSTTADPDDFFPWQYFARTPVECLELYGISAATHGKPKPLAGPNPTCTLFYSKLQPMEYGEIHVTLVSDEDENWNRAQFVRIRLLGLHGSGRPDRRYYTLRDITVGGRCTCHGHAHNCRHNVARGRPDCECIHHTCGPNCDHCCPMYNQIPFLPGTLTEANICQPCQCNGHASECIYSKEVDEKKSSVDTHGRFKGGGVCVNCQKHTAGINCEKCKNGHYRPPHLLPDDEEPCIKCNCDHNGSTGNCEYDEIDDIVRCECISGFSGNRCEKCNAGYRGYPKCEICPCNSAGSTSIGDCLGDCQCKFNVEGAFCDLCKEGYFALDANNPEGCSPCYCSGVSKVCQSTVIENHVFQTLENWVVTDISVSQQVTPLIDIDSGLLLISNFEFPSIESYYWSAPHLYLGNKLKAYGARLVFNVGWVVMRGDTSGKPTTGPNVILIGHNGLRIAFDDIYYPQKGDELEIVVPLKEQFWYHVPPSLKDIVTRLRRTEYRGDHVSRIQFMSVLSNIKHILLRAKFHTDQAEGSLENMFILIGNGKSESVISAVEKCSCPPGYTGLSCEICAFGYVGIFTNASNHMEQFECIKCNCNGHAETCDLLTGKCATCEHNTMGEKCERCISGHYGNPLLGTHDDCKRCACPLLIDSNNFSPSCSLDGNLGDDYFCTQCPEGYTGDHCEICDYGFFGEPTVLGSTCETCSCNGGPCNSTTGQCLSCPGNTEGFKCESCKPDHYGIASEKDCKPCECDAIGSESTTCDRNNGQCLCKEHYAGRSCSNCKEGFGNISAGCTPCTCDKIGSSDLSCDPVTGHCSCQPGVEGFHCDACQYLHYGFSLDGCKSCNCNERGSEIKSCDIKTGQCRCLPHVVGLTCDQCEAGFWGLNTGLGCSKCICDPLGTVNGTCDDFTGACRCKTGIGGERCDTCLPDYYGFSNTGCLKCGVCLVGQICDPDTGRCICPPLSQGAGCKECRPGSWGLVPYKGCKYCNCSALGATVSKCNPYDGTCTCREGYGGDRCDNCAPMHYGYPRCRPCACHYSGTVPEACDQFDKCHCDAKGQCPCKLNVVGQKCNECKNGTFGLSADSPSGCTQCFCFGRSSHCTEAGLTWGQLRLYSPRTLRITSSGRPDPYGPAISFISITKIGELPLDLYSEDQNLTLNMTSGVTIIPDTEGNITIETNYDLTYPLYWELPKKFLGDRVTSYGGLLKFHIGSFGDSDIIPPHILKDYPLVQLHAQGVLILEYHERHPYSNEYYNVRFHESLWTLRSSKAATSLSPTAGLAVDRMTLMVALQNVDAIFIRASHYTTPSEAKLSNVVMDTAIPVEGHPARLATSVELCSCPLQYNASSCQDASIGYFIPPFQFNNFTEDIIIELIGKAEPCQCNGRSETCDKDTGYCTNCRENTGGRYCESCAVGHYGDVNSFKGCQPCPCPHAARNHATSCQIKPGRALCYCKTGYTGHDCSSCAPGWWLGNDGKCRACECNSGGVTRNRQGSSECHPTTGQCPCHSYVTGMHCDVCITPRHYLEGSTCIPCDNCSQTLLDTIELMSYELTRDTEHIKNTSIPKPWTALYKLSNKTKEISNHIHNMYAAIEHILSRPTDSFDDMKYKSEKLLERSLGLSDRWNATTSKSCKLKQDADLMFDNLMNVRKRLEGRIQELEGFSRHERHLNQNKVLKEARNTLKKIKNISLAGYLQNANDIFGNGSLQSAVIHEYIYKIKDHENKLEDFKNRFDTLHNKADEINKFKDDTWDIIDIVKASIEKSTDRLNDILERNVQSEAIHEDIIKLQDHHLNQESVVLLEEIEDDLLNLMNLKPIIVNLSNRIEEKDNVFGEKNPNYEEKYLIPAISHVDNLTSVALKYKDLFTETKNSSGSAVIASSAYKDIVQGIKAARDAASEALKASGLASKTVEYQKISNQIEGPLLALSEASKSNSTVHFLRASQQIKKVEDMSTELNKSRQKVDRIRLTIREQAWNDKYNYINATKLSSQKVRNALAIANNKSDRVYKNMRALYKEADDIDKDTLYKLRVKLSELQSHGDDKIGGAEENVSLLRGNIRKANESVTSLLNAAQLRIAEINRSNSSLAHNMQLLRDQIQRAKHAADGIRISLQSATKNGCYRSYHLPSLSPSTTTRISATLALSPSNAHDSVLFHLPSSTTGDFVKLELVNRKVRFSWNLGGDTAYILNPEKLEMFTDVLSDYSWYRVDAERIWNIGKLYVSKVVPESPEILLSPKVPASNTSNPAWGVFDVKSGDLAWIGSIGPTLQKSPGLSGCINKIYFNDRQIGLWNFHSQPNKDSCKGCVEPVNEISHSEHNIYYWNGAGYSVLKRSDLRPYNKNQFSILLTFRTFDENALLFLAVDEANNRSVSLQIREGRVVFRIDYAGESRLEINTTDKYNTGKLVQVQAARVFIRNIEKGSLNVDGNELQGSPNPPVINSASLPDLIDSDYLLGGTPPLWKPSPSIHSLPPALLGCLGDLMIDEEGYNPMEATVSYGMESLCATKLLSSVGFYGDGYLELPSHTLRRKSHIGFMFRTLQPNAFLLLSSPHFYHVFRSNEVISDYLYTTTPNFIYMDDISNNEGFYSFALVEGRIHLLMNAGKGDLKLVSNMTALNDGLFHSLSIVKNGRKVELFVDDIVQATGALPQGSVVVHAKSNGEGGGLFLGGVPEILNDTDVTDQHIASTVPLRGAIKDVVFDGTIISMNDVVSMNHALIGRLGPPMGEGFDIGANLLNTEQSESNSNRTSKGCHKVNSYTLEPGAVKFGDVSNSYAQVHLTGRNIWPHDFAVEFDFRTFYPNGLLFMTPGTKEKQRHLLAVFLKDGKVTLSMKGRKKKKLSTVPDITNDGSWHHVVIRSIQKKLTMTVGQNSTYTTVPRKLFLTNMLYVGGLPDKSSAIIIPEQMAKIEGFKGCIRRLNVNGKQEDLVKDAALHQNVGQCFPTIERGSYFPGDAFAIYKKQFVIGSHLELQLEFRTVEMNGVLLSIAHSNINSPSLSLELLNAKVVISVRTVSGRRIRVETSLPTQFGLCDNTWHNISALFSANELTVRVDQQPEETDVWTHPAYGSSTPPSINQATVPTPLYIGGLPDGAPTGTLTTKDNFKGCIRNVSIRGYRKDWTDMDYLHNLLLSSCPVQ